MSALSRVLASPGKIMPICKTCGEKLGPYAALCHMCGTAVPGAAPPAPVVGEEPEQTEPAESSHTVRPAAGTPCLVLYGADKQPLGYFPLDKDALLIGRLDAVAGIFPDVDVTEFLDQAVARKVSRQHALILRSRATQTHCLRPLAGNTGTQLETDMVAPLQDYPLKPGARLVLGGVVRLKFEIA